MSTRLKGFTVILEDDIREDCSEYIVNAIKMIKGVQQVQPIENCHADNMTEYKIKHEIGSKIVEFGWELKK